MKVNELREILRELPPDMEVSIEVTANAVVVDGDILGVRVCRVMMGQAMILAELLGHDGQ